MDKGDSHINQALAWVRTKMNAARDFYVETRLEMQRVTWPTRKQVQATTIVVIVTVFFFGLYFHILDDWILAPIIRLLFRKAGIQAG